MKLINFISIYIISSKLFAAACCGGGTAFPTLITGDYQAQMGLSASNATVIYDVNDKGDVDRVDDEYKEVNELYQVFGAYQIEERTQLGIQIPVVSNYRENAFANEHSKGLGDPGINMAYEILPERFYSAWKPRGFLFTSLNIPLAKSKYNATKTLSTDSLGTGFYQLSAGLIFVRHWESIDAQYVSSFRNGFSRRFSTDRSTIRVNPGRTYVNQLGLGYNIGEFRIGGSLAYEQSTAIKITGDVENTSASKYFWTSSINFSYVIKNYSMNLIYSDQTLIGPAKNSFLSRALGLTILKFVDL